MTPKAAEAPAVPDRAGPILYHRSLDFDAELARLLDPQARWAREVTDMEQATEVYLASCSRRRVDHFMERGYLDELAPGLGSSMTI